MSGEFAALEALAAMGLADRAALHREILIASGAPASSMIITYGARYARDWLSGLSAGSSRSEELFLRARRVSRAACIPRCAHFRGVGGTPRFMTGGPGAWLHDVDGREYLDFCMAFGPLILGHADAGIREAAEAALARGWSLGTAEP